MSAPAPSPAAGGGAEPLPRQEEVLTDAALAFVAELHRRFTPRRDELLARRAERRAEIARTGTLDFLPETAEVRSGEWRGGPAPPPLGDRRGGGHRPPRPPKRNQTPPPPPQGGGARRADAAPPR